jgi:hypothetical protein
VREVFNGFWVAYILGITSPMSKIKNVTATTCMIKPSKGFALKSNNSSITNVERITVAILMKLMLIRTVARTVLGAFMSCSILPSFFDPELFSSSISVGVNEKKADSAAETRAAQNNNNNIESMETAILTVKDLIIIPITGV